MVITGSLHLKTILILDNWEVIYIFVGTHYCIGSFIYKSVLSNFQKSSLLNKYLFKWGNVLPDIHHKLSQVDHYVEHTLEYVKVHSKMIQDQTIPTNQRFISLGIICHFLSDYFCTYHALAPYKNRSMLRHLFYELKLHVCMRYSLLFPNQLQEKLSISKDITYPNIEDLILSLQRDYFKERTSIMNDILFALRATSIAIAHLQEVPANSLESVMEMIWWSRNSSERSFL